MRLPTSGFAESIPPHRELVRLDKMVHEPTRLSILTAVQDAGGADFTLLLHLTGPRKGSLRTQLTKLALLIDHEIDPRVHLEELPVTSYGLSMVRRNALTTAGSNWEPALVVISSQADWVDIPRR